MRVPCIAATTFIALNFFFLHYTNCQRIIVSKESQLFMLLYMHVFVVPCIYNGVFGRIISLPLTLMSTSHILILCFYYFLLISLYSLIAIMMLIWSFKITRHVHPSFSIVYCASVASFAAHGILRKSISPSICFGLVVYRCSGFLNILLFC